MTKFAASTVSALGVLLGLAACSPPPSQVRDTGNMQYPAPLPQGNVANTGGLSRAPTDTGNMAYPAPLPQGNIGTTSTVGAPRRPTDTGNMQYPAPLPAGNVGTTTLSR